MDDNYCCSGNCRILPVNQKIETKYNDLVVNDLLTLLTKEELENFDHSIIIVVDDNKDYIGVVTYVIDKTFSGNELVISNLIGHVNTFIDLVHETLVNLALLNKCKRVRLYVKSKPIEKLLKKYGFEYSETILTKEI